MGGGGQAGGPPLAGAAITKGGGPVRTCTDCGALLQMERETWAMFRFPVRHKCGGRFLPPVSRIGGKG